MQMMHLAQGHVLICVCGGMLCVLLVLILDTIPTHLKHFLVTKPEHAEKAKQLFAGTNVSICAGKCCLGAAIGSKSFTEEYVRKKVCTWVEEAKSLACIAATHPHSAYSAFTHGLSSRWTFVSRTMSDIQNLLVPLEHAIHEYLLPALTGRPSCSSLEHSYLALPVRLGGLGIANPTKTSAPAFLASVKLTAPLTSMIVSTGTTEIQLDYNLLQSLKRDISSENHKSLQQKAEGIYKILPPSLQRCFDQACEKRFVLLVICPSHCRSWLPSKQRRVVMLCA